MAEEQDAERIAAAAAQDEQPETAPPAVAADNPAVVEPIVPGTTDGVVPLSPLDAPTIAAPPPDYSTAGVPSLDFVRDKIEGRYARSLGSTELAEETPEARSFQEQAEKREHAAQDKLEAIRRSLRDGSSS